MLAQHKKLIDASAITDEVAEAREYRSVSTKAELRSLGFSAAQQRVPALLAPIFDVRGEIVNYHLRPDEPRVKDGRALKYETPTGSRMAVDVPPSIRAKLGDPGVPLWITEGVRKADSAVSAGLCCVALMGTWCWRGTNDAGGKTLLADFESIALDGRTVYVVFDSDVIVKRSVHAAVERFAPVLRNRGADVRIVYLPDGPNGEKVGLDDYLSAGHTTEELLALAERELRPLPRDEADGRYSADDHGLVWNSSGGGGSKRVRIASFSARIVADRELRDGAEVSRSFEIEAVLPGRSERIVVSTQQFKDGSWVLEQLGADAILEAIPRASDHLAAGIQHLSGEIPKTIVYGHTGWAQISGSWVYLSGSGGIGADGPVAVDVELPEGLRGFALPDPPQDDELTRAVRTSLKLLDLGPATVTFALLASVYRAPLGSPDLVAFVVGQTGSLKTAIAAVAQQHFGAELDAHHLPLSFTDTANSLEGQLFVLKDVLAVIDDFAPGGTRTDVQRSHRDADRVFRSSANRQGRRRMRADTSIRPPKPPRAQILGTGEDLPQGHSIRARTHAIQTDPGTIDPQRLAELQREADEGVLSSAMAGYVQWLATRYGEINATLKTELSELRELARGTTTHRRSVDGAASLALGLWYFLEFAESSGAINPVKQKDLWDRGLEAILAGTAFQEQHHQDADPVPRYLALLASALATGTAHVADLHGHAPNNHQAWGWRDGSPDAEPQGRRIGWTDGSDLYLDRDGAYAAAQRLASETGEALPIAAAMLARRLHEHGLLASTEQSKRSTLTVRRTLEGTRRSVLHFHSDALLPAADAQGSTGDNPTSPTTHPTSGQAPTDGPQDASGRAGRSGQEGEEASRSAADADQLSLSTTPPPTMEADQPDQPDQPDQRVPCPYPQHRSSDWQSRKSGLRVCGICHPPATPDVVAHEIETPSAPF